MYRNRATHRSTLSPSVECLNQAPVYAIISHGGKPTRYLDRTSVTRDWLSFKAISKPMESTRTEKQVNLLNREDVDVFGCTGVESTNKAAQSSQK